MEFLKGKIWIRLRRGGAVLPEAKGLARAPRPSVSGPRKCGFQE